MKIKTACDFLIARALVLALRAHSRALASLAYSSIFEKEKKVTFVYRLIMQAFYFARLKVKAA